VHISLCRKKREGVGNSYSHLGSVCSCTREIKNAFQNQNWKANLLGKDRIRGPLWVCLKSCLGYYLAWFFPKWVLFKYLKGGNRVSRKVPRRKEGITAAEQWKTFSWRRPNSWNVQFFCFGREQMGVMEHSMQRSGCPLLPFSKPTDYRVKSEPCICHSGAFTTPPEQLLFCSSPS
jgi:hypothetical protein